MPLLEIDDLSLSLSAGRAARPILSHVSLTVEQGETVGLVGESGSGKSVTSRAALGLVPEGASTTGAVRVGGADVLRMSARETRRLRSQEAAMIFQDPRASINPMRRIGDFVTEGMRTNLGLSRPAANARAAELLDSVGIRDPEGALRRFPHEFSGGMLQRVMIAAALAAEPQLLLADEPTTALDVTTQAEVIAIITRLTAERGTGVLFVTHNLELAAAICDRIYVMYAGHVVETQQVDDLFRTPRHPYTTALLGSTPRLGGDAGSLVTIPGRPVSLAEAPPGCPFTARCEHVQPRCHERMPDLAPLPAGGASACLRTDEIAHELATAAARAHSDERTFR
jgi:peptide/nickel transport system ATP-binding protein